MIPHLVDGKVIPAKIYLIEYENGRLDELEVADISEIGPHLNKRGVTSRSMTEGGKQEYDLADRYERWAEAVQATHPRTAGVLRGVAETYREEGRRNDEEAKRFLEGLDRRGGCSPWQGEDGEGRAAASAAPGQGGGAGWAGLKAGGAAR